MTALHRLLEDETAGDPMSGQKWARSSLRRLSQRLTDEGYPLSPPTVGRLLEALGYALRVNAKQREARAGHPERDRQFAYIGAQRQAFQATGQPVISVDPKKKELIGDFKHAGRRWCQHADVVGLHDFPQDALGRAVPYGIDDVTHQRGAVYVGQSADTPAFAVAVLARWWADSGRARFPAADQLLILADGGGSNSARSRQWKQQWKQQLQTQLCDRHRLTVTVCHYPPGCSKWNPVEHRLFSQISLNWAGKPLRTWETLLAAIRGTTTATGLQVDAVLHAGCYPLGQQVTDAAMQALHLAHHLACPAWNYTLRPRTADWPETSPDDTHREVIP